MNAIQDLPTMPAAVREGGDAGRTARQAEVVAALAAVLPAHALLYRREDTTPYECDGLTAYRQTPLVVALPETEAQVATLPPMVQAIWLDGSGA